MSQQLTAYQTICVAIAIAIIGHIVLVIGALPELLVNNQNAAYGITITAIVVMGVGTGAFKSNISPLIAEQTPDKQLRVATTKRGESVIVDPALTVARIMMVRIQTKWLWLELIIFSVLLPPHKLRFFSRSDRNGVCRTGYRLLAELHDVSGLLSDGFLAS